jgi:two-component system, chemotaxis family, protein-glutamate methylesterase/glutaminase
MKQEVATRPQVRVLVVDDSAFMRTALSRMIASEAGFEVAATACGGADALEKISSLDPDVVTLDIEMPGLDGLQTLRYIMNQFPRPVIMVSALTEEGAEQTLDALAAGAFDYVSKHLSSSSLDILHIRQDLLGKIRAAAQSRKSHPINVPENLPSRPHYRLATRFPPSPLQSSLWELRPGARKRFRKFCLFSLVTFLCRS